jgi:hypothetical protein
MKHWWRKLAIDWPCALGDWLWAILVAAMPQWIGGLTRRQLLHWAVFIFLLLSWQTVLALDLTFLFAMDLGLLMEISAAIFIISVRDGFQGLHAKIKQSFFLVRSRTIYIYKRVARAGRHVVRALKPPADDDGRAGVFGLSLAA